MLAFLLAYTIAPNLATWLYGELRTPVYFERYLIPTQVGFLLTVAMGILAIYDFRFTILDFGFSIGNIKKNLPLLPRSPAPLLLATLLLATLLSIDGYALWQHYFNPAYAKDDWRAVARKIEAFEMPGDAVVITGDGGEKAFNYYYQGSLPIYLDFHTPVPSEDKARDIIANIAATHRRVWYTPYGVEINSTLESWLAEQAYPAWHSWLGRKRLALYDTSAATNRPAGKGQYDFYQFTRTRTNSGQCGFIERNHCRRRPAPLEANLADSHPLGARLSTLAALD